MSFSRNSKYQSALKDMENQNYESALHKMQELSKEFPGNWLVIYSLGKIKYHESLKTQNSKLKAESQKHLKEARHLLENSGSKLTLESKFR